MLQFVSQSDNIRSCKFAQTMEQRLQRAFQDAQRKVLNTKSNLTIQVRRKVLQLCSWQRPTGTQMLARSDLVPHFKAAWCKCNFVLRACDINRRRCHFGATELSQAWQWWGCLGCGGHDKGMLWHCVPAVIWDLIFIFPSLSWEGLKLP